MRKLPQAICPSGQSLPPPRNDDDDNDDDDDDDVIVKNISNA